MKTEKVPKTKREEAKRVGNIFEGILKTRPKKAPKAGTTSTKWENLRDSHFHIR